MHDTNKFDLFIRERGRKKEFLSLACLPPINIDDSMNCVDSNVLKYCAYIAPHPARASNETMNYAINAIAEQCAAVAMEKKKHG